MRCVVLFLSLLLLTSEAYAAGIYKCKRDHFVEVTKDKCNDAEMTCPFPEFSDEEAIYQSKTGPMPWGYVLVILEDKAVLEHYVIDASGWRQMERVRRFVFNKLEGADYDYKMEMPEDRDYRPPDNFLRLSPVADSEEKMRFDLVGLSRRVGASTGTLITSWSCTAGIS